VTRGNFSSRVLQEGLGILNADIWLGHNELVPLGHDISNLGRLGLRQKGQISSADESQQLSVAGAIVRDEDAAHTLLGHELLQIRDGRFHSCSVGVGNAISLSSLHLLYHFHLLLHR